MMIVHTLFPFVSTSCYLHCNTHKISNRKNIKVKYCSSSDLFLSACTHFCSLGREINKTTIVFCSEALRDTDPHSRDCELLGNMVSRTVCCFPVVPTVTERRSIEGGQELGIQGRKGKNTVVANT